MTGADVLERWRQVDGAVWFGVAVYLYLTRRTSRQRLALANRRMERLGLLLKRQEILIDVMLDNADLFGQSAVEQDDSTKAH